MARPEASGRQSPLPTAHEPVTIGLLGDVMLGRGVATHLEEVEPGELWSADVKEVLGACDAVVCNLECCISTRGAPTRLIPGKPFFFRAPPAAVEALRAVGTCAVGLANNHALDFGTEALIDTLEELGEARIPAAGAGHDVEQARRAVVFETPAARVALVAVADHPREYAAGAKRPGIALADLSRGTPDWLEEQIAAARVSSDLVIAFPHWGPNMTVRPARWQKARAGELIDAGADLVGGHSAHLFHGIERRGSGLVLYDLGDALDDYAVDPDLRNDLGIAALWRPGGTPELELVGLRLDYCHTDLATGADADWIAHRLQSACAELGTAVERIAEQRFRVG